MSVLPEPEGERQAVASTLAIILNFSVPFVAPYGDFGIYNTEYRTVMSLTRRSSSWLAASGLTVLELSNRLLRIIGGEGGSPD